MMRKHRWIVIALALLALVSTSALAGCGGSSSATVDKLQIKDTKVGEGAEVKSGDTVTVDYTGWLYVDGQKTTQFDTSIGKQPFKTVIGTGQVIPGWDQGIVGMKVGGTRDLIIPPALGYGAQGSPPTIPGNSTLYFEVTLISIN